MPASNKQDRFQREMELLALIAESARASAGEATLSRKALSALMGVSDYRIGYSLDSMMKAGFLVSEARYAADGGRLSNAYYLTELGRKMLDKWRTKERSVATPETNALDAQVLLANESVLVREIMLLASSKARCASVHTFDQMAEALGFSTPLVKAVMRALIDQELITLKNYTGRKTCPKTFDCALTEEGISYLTCILRNVV